MARPPRVRSITLEEALAETAEVPRTLLLGNGFSIAAHREFSYDALLNAAGEMNIRLRQVFRRLGTTDFESVVQSLHEAREILRLYVDDRSTARRIGRDIEQLKSRLIRAIAAVHPLRPYDLTDAQYLRCRRFLENFIGPGRGEASAQVFTTNYDLLLYWVIAKYFAQLQCDDGFRGNPLTWSEASDDQSVFFMHGGLHLFERDEVVHKLRSYNGTLIDQMQERLEADELPLFVSEGSSVQKVGRIRANPYLSHARRHFRRSCRVEASALFTIGHGLKEQDAHITDLIGRGRVSGVYVGAFGGLNSMDGVRARQLALQWSEMRQEADHPEVVVRVFDSNACTIW